MMHGFMTHLVQRSLGVSKEVRPRPVTPFEADAMRGSSELMNSRSDLSIGDQHLESEGGPVSGLQGVVSRRIEAASPPIVTSLHEAPLYEYATAPSRQQDRLLGSGLDKPERQGIPASWGEPASSIPPSGSREEDAASATNRIDSQPLPPMRFKPIDNKRLTSDQQSDPGRSAVRAAERTEVVSNDADSRHRTTSQVAPQPVRVSPSRADDSVPQPRASKSLTKELPLTRREEETESRTASAEARHPKASIRPAAPVHSVSREAETEAAAKPKTRNAQPQQDPAINTSQPTASRQVHLKPRLPPLLEGSLKTIPEKTAADPVIHVTIGRVEIRAVTSAPEKSAKSASPTKPTLSLGDYLERRGGGRK